MTELLAQQFRNDKEKRVVIPEFCEAKYPGSRERFSSARRFSGFRIFRLWRNSGMTGKTDQKERGNIR